ncbi:3099_t:CDS:2 [Paraglomus brasilianum]|uniref:Carbonic anhydrase n=1 Tax=Paraglomus brasilianum TaxID=144538 RepID=A0A9N9C9A8_9GLOM|nr:3099_t:CDS:2 [Paraglomus brasilianum]
MFLVTSSDRRRGEANLRDAKYTFPDDVEFAYSGKKAPEFWGSLSEEFALCSTGKRQSPIDIPKYEFARKSTPPIPSFKNARGLEIAHIGNTVEIGTESENEVLPLRITINHKEYQMQQMHFHTPSEHRVNGKHFDAEGHMVFTRKDHYNNTIIAVVAILYEVSDYDNEFLVPITKKLPMKRGEKKKIEKVEFEQLLCDLKDLKRAYNYIGSLTTPPCSEGVKWYINRKIQPISFHQFKDLRNSVGFNSRFAQLRYSAQEFGRRGVL